MKDQHGNNINIEVIKKSECVKIVPDMYFNGLFDAKHMTMRCPAHVSSTRIYTVEGFQAYFKAQNEPWIPVVDSMKSMMKAVNLVAYDLENALEELNIKRDDVFLPISDDGELISDNPELLRRMERAMKWKADFDQRMATTTAEERTLEAKELAKRSMAPAPNREEQGNLYAIYERDAHAPHPVVIGIAENVEEWLKTSSHPFRIGYKYYVMDLVKGTRVLPCPFYKAINEGLEDN